MIEIISQAGETRPFSIISLFEHEVTGNRTECGIIDRDDILRMEMESMAALIVPQNTTKEMLAELKTRLLGQPDIEQFRISVDGYPGSRSIIFLSACNGINRASVVKGVGNSLDSAWKNASDNLKHRMEELSLVPVWIKADLVHQVTSYGSAEFLDHVSSIKRNYFREGISFDSMFQTAFLEQEVNGNNFLTQDQDASRVQFLWKNINFYLKQQGVKTSLEESKVQKVFTFQTVSVFHDGERSWELHPDSLNQGRRKVSAQEPHLILSLIDKSSRFLARQVLPSGRFEYGYFPCFNKSIDTYNILRHASSTYAMIEAYEITKDEKLALAIQSGIHFLITEGIERLEDLEGTRRAFVIERSSDNEIKLGANAAAILALVQYTKVFGDQSHISLMEELAEGIAYFQNKQDGSFVHVLHYPDLSLKEKRRTIYYDGEAAFALLRLYGITHMERWLRIAVNAFDYFIREEYWNHKDHWLSYASLELIQYCKEKKYIEFNLKNCSGILEFCLQRETTYPTLLELLMATWRLVEMIRRDEGVSDSLAKFNEEKLMEAILHRAEHQLNGFFFPEVAMYFKAPAVILDSFFIRHHAFRSRIDDNEHNISGYCSFYHHILGNQRT